MRVAIPLEQCWHDVPGGTARTAIDLADALARHARLDVVGVAARHTSPPAPAWRPTVPVSHLRLPRSLLYESWHGLRWPRVESATGPVDLVHVVGGAVAASRAPLVVTVHDLAFLHHPELFTRHGGRFFRRALRLTADRAAVVIVPSRATLDDCVAAGIERDRLHVVPWGVNVTSPGEGDVEAARRRYGLDGPYVMAVGTLEPRKNLTGLLRAWRLLARADVRLVVVGPPGWGDAVDPELLDDTVTMTGFVDDAVRDALYAGAAATAYPSLFEGFGLPVVEAMALGCPVVTSAGTSTAELVEDGAGIAVDPTEPAAIAAALGSVLDDDRLRGRLSARGRERAATYSWEAAASTTAAIYRKLLR